MKVKPFYLYGITFLIIIAAIVFVSYGDNTTPDIQTSSNMPADAVHQRAKMPNDAIHNGAAENGPSKNNVRKEFWDKLEKAKTDLEANPTDTLLMREYADLLAMSHRTNDAVKIYEQILAVDPNRIDILLAEGATFFNGQNFQMAEIVTKKIISKEPNNLEAQYNLGVIAAAEKRNAKAIKIWNDLARKYPDTEIGKLAATSVTKLNEEKN